MRNHVAGKAKHIYCLVFIEKNLIVFWKKFHFYYFISLLLHIQFEAGHNTFFNFKYILCLLRILSHYYLQNFLGYAFSPLYSVISIS